MDNFTSDAFIDGLAYDQRLVEEKPSGDHRFLHPELVTRYWVEGLPHHPTISTCQRVKSLCHHIPPQDVKRIMRQLSVCMAWWAGQALMGEYSPRWWPVISSPCSRIAFHTPIPFGFRPIPMRSHPGSTNCLEGSEHWRTPPSRDPLNGQSFHPPVPLYASGREWGTFIIYVLWQWFMDKGSDNCKEKVRPSTYLACSIRGGTLTGCPIVAESQLMFTDTRFIHAGGFHLQWDDWQHPWYLIWTERHSWVRHYFAFAWWFLGELKLPLPR